MAQMQPSSQERRCVSDGEKSSKAPTPGIEARRFNRDHVYIPIDIREHGGGRHKGQMIDLSQSGCRLNCPVLLNLNRRVFVTLPELAPLEVEVVWKQGDEYGCSFHNGLHQAVYDHIVAKFPSLGGY